MGRLIKMGGLALLLAIAALGIQRVRSNRQPASIPTPRLRLADEPGLRGLLRLSLYGPAPRQGVTPTTHHTTVVNSRQYHMEDNDLRGFLDGVFQWGWNQPGQHHVRIGRRPTDAIYGEHEVFRVLQRWDPIELPSGVAISNVRLALELETGPADSVRVELYEVKKDWNPGQGGVHGDNASPPKPGEVWWNDIAFQRRPWGLPGAGFASDQHPDADTGAEPLAEAQYRTVKEGLAFASAELDAYVERRLLAGEPLLFLLKLSDYQEDQPGSWVTVWSSDFGDSANSVRRPRLSLNWTSRAEIQTHSFPIALEYGRALPLPRRSIGAASHVAASFETEPGYDPPTLEARFTGQGGATAWVSLDRLVRVPAAAGHLEVRVIAAPAPLALGQAFRTQLRESWIYAAAPDDKMVRFTFISPTGIEQQRQAAYNGGSRWSVEFVPDELGRWRYSWEGNFEAQPFRSAEGRIDVVAGSPAEISGQLDSLAVRLQRQRDSLSPEQRGLWMIRFARLERAALQQETPESFRSADGSALRRQLLAIRAILGGPVPDSIPMRAFPAPQWVRDRWGVVGDQPGPHGLSDVHPKK